MIRPLCLLRPEPGWSRTATAADERGIAAIGEPLFVGEPVAWQAPKGHFDGLLAGSARAFALGGEALQALRHLPVFAVGQATADAAKGAGFSVTRTGCGNLQQLLDRSAGEALRLVRLMGEEHVALTPPPGVTLAEIITYRMAARPVSSLLAQAAREQQPVVALHSAAAALHWRSECGRLGIDRQLLVILALSQRIATAAGAGWRSVYIAERPEDAALLAKAQLLCKG